MGGWIRVSSSLVRGVEINQANEVLTDDELRAKFDAGEDPNDPMGGQGPHQHHHQHHGGFGNPMFFQGSPFGFGGGGGGGGGQQQHFEWRF